MTFRCRRGMPFVFAVICFVSFALPGPTGGLLRAEEKPVTEPLKLMDVFQLEFASDPQISPDAARIVYVRNFMDVMKDRKRSNLWLIHRDGSDPRPLTTGSRNDGWPRWSPDGKRIAYVATVEGRGEIYSRWLETGETARLTQVAKEPEHLAWSPDGRMLAFTMFVPAETKPFVELPKKPEGAEWAEPPKVIRRSHYRADGKGYLKDGFRHVFVLPAEGGTPRQITQGEFHHEGPLAWSPDGTSVFCAANRSPRWEYEPRTSEVIEIAVAGDSIRQVTQGGGPNESPAVSPDGKRIAFTTFEDRKLSHQTTRLSVMNRNGSGLRVLTESLDRDAEAPVWSEKGDGLYFKYDDEGTTRVAFVTLEGKVTPLAGGLGGATLGRPYASGSFSVARDGTVAYTWSQPSFPADVAVVTKKGGEPQRVTRLNEDLFSQRRLGEVEEFWFESAFDGKKIQAWLVKPPGFDAKGEKKHPLLLEIHGGPFANYGSRFSAEMQLYAAAGYCVLYVNPRGSTGYGEDFANLIHHKYPANDFDDLMSAVDAVIARGFIDEDALFVTGGSGGGILTAWIVSHTNRFRAAVSAKPVINWHSFALTSDLPALFTQYWFPKMPWEDPEHYAARSPLTYVDKVETPTMLITGEEDYRTPISEAEQFYQALKLRGIDTALVRVPDASHDIVARPSRLMMQVAYTLKWFETHTR